MKGKPEERRQNIRRPRKRKPEDKRVFES